MRTSLFVSGLALVAAAVGCGAGINSRDNSSIATVSGTLTGSSKVPAGARVALVWHSPTGAFVVSHEAAVVDGAFTIDLSTPPSDDLFFAPGDSSVSESGGGATNGSSGTADPPPDVSGGSAGGSSSSSGGMPKPGSKSSAKNVSIKDVVSGGTVSDPMTVAVAGFVLYLDSNANGHLDLTGDTADSPDQIIGGSRELLLTYLRDGSTLDLEKLRDHSGQLPTRGYDLVWTEQNRWLPLSAVEISLSTDGRLPDQVCYVNTISGGSGGVAFADAPVATPAPRTDPAEPSSSSSSSGSSGSDPTYPPAGDPAIECGPDGTYFTYGECPPPPPEKTGLCRGYSEPMGCAKAYYTVPSPVPSNWPCPILKDDGGTPTDAGPAPDAGDAGVPDSGG